MQNGVLDAADVLVHRQPVLHALIDHGTRIVAAGEAQKVPRGVDECVHGVGLTPRLCAASRAAAGEKGRILEQRIAAAVRHQILRQHHRQIGIRHRHRAACRALDYGDGPVAQSPGRLFLAETKTLEIGGNGIHRRLKFQAVVCTRIDAAPMLGVPRLPGRGAVGAPRQCDHGLDRQGVFQCELEIPLIVGGHAHDRALAIAHEHVIAHPQRHRRTA